MRILHVVALLTPDNAYGGPVTVALNQCAQLQRRGHDVVIAAGSKGYAEPPTKVSGVPAHLFPVLQVIPGTGFAGLGSPALVRFVRKHAQEFDVVHVHLARDFVTLPAAAAALRSGTRVAVQTHGMVDPSSRLLARPLDAVLTKRVLRGADTVFHFTEDEAGWLQEIAGNSLRLQLLPNGVTVPDQPAPFPERPQVLFCGRLQTRKRPLVFVETAATLLAEGVDADFVLVGADEGEGPGVQQRIDEIGDERLRWMGGVPPGEVVGFITASQFVALPAVDEPFGMVVAEALAAGRPAVVTNSCGIRDLVGVDAGAVVDDSQQSFTAAVRRLLDSNHQEAGQRAHEIARANLAIESVGATLVDAYSRTTVHRRVVILQPYVPTYRISLFEQLRDRLAGEGVELRVLAGYPEGGQAARGDSTDADFIDRLRSWNFSVAGHSFGLKRIGLSVDGADLVVSELKATALENFWLTFRYRGRHALWGHAYATVGEASKIDQALEHWLMRRAAHVFTYTEKGGSAARAAGVPDERVTVLRNTVDTTGLRSAIAELEPSAVEAFRTDHGLRGGPVVASIGALDESKRIDFLLESIELICAELPDLDVIIAGDGEQAERVRTFAASHPGVHAVGRIGDEGKAVIAELASLLLNPGRVGLLAVESLVMGTPIVTTIWPYHSVEFEYLRSGENAFVTEDSVEQFTREVIDLVCHPLRLQGVQKRALSESDRYDLSGMVTRFAGGFSNVLRQSTS